MIRLIPIWLFLCVTPVLIVAQPRVFVAPMEEGFDAFLTAALLDNNVPVRVTADECSASYVITGQSVRGQNKWYDTVFGAERDRNQGSIKLLRVVDRSVVWAGAAGDRSLWWGALKSGGQKKVANRLARELKKGYFNRVITEDFVGNCESSASSAPSADTSSSRSTGTEAVVELTSRPDGAEIEINGKVLGRTPTTLNVRPGEHTITVRHSGYRPWVKFIRIGAGEKLAINAEMTSY